MWRKAIACAVLGMLAVPAVSNAQFKQGDWEFTLSGSGSNDKDFETGAFTVAGSGGYFLNDQVEVGLRQGITWGDGGSSWDGDTRVFADYHFDLDRWQPFVGANLGYIYGDNVDDAWIAGPEAGVKYFVNSTTFIQLSAAYEFDLNNGFDGGSFFYGLGIGFRM